MTKLSREEIEKQIVAAKAAATEYSLQSEVHRIVQKAFEKELIRCNIAKKGKTLNKPDGIG